MKISKLFHYLYAAIMFLPLLLLPVFMIYSHRHDLSTDITITQDVYKDFYQGVKNGKPYNLDFIDVEATDYEVINNVLHVAIEGANNINIYYDTDIEFVGTHEYYFSFDVGTPSYNDNLYLNFSNDDGGLLIEDYLLVNNTINHISSLTSPGIEYSDESLSHIHIYGEDIDGLYFDVFNFELFDVTAIFGIGNEPSQEVFESYLTLDYYDFGNNQVKVGTNQVPVKNNDIMSVFMDSFNTSLNKYFNMRRVFNLESLYQWFNVNFFASAAPIGFNILFNLFVYWLFVSLLWLLFDFFMYIPLVIHNGIDKARIE